MFRVNCDVHQNYPNVAKNKAIVNMTVTCLLAMSQFLKSDKFSIKIIGNGMRGNAWV